MPPVTDNFPQYFILKICSCKELYLGVDFLIKKLYDKRQKKRREKKMVDIKKELRKRHLCPVCAVKKLVASRNVRTDGVDRFENGVALTPPMGWASWNLFRNKIDEKLIEEIADALVKTGLADCGYQYVNIDDCWMSSVRDENGRLAADPATFPSGIPALVEKVNEKGLKLGIYNSNGTLTCEDLPGTLYHERTDAETFAEWGIEYFKYDFCHNEPIPTAAPEITKLMFAVPGENESIFVPASSAELRGNAALLTDEKLPEPHEFITGLDFAGGSAVFCDIDIPEEGDYNLTLGIRKFALVKKYAEVKINGVDIYPVTVPATKGFTREGRAYVGLVHLKKGRNSVIVTNPVASRIDSAAKQYRNMGKELKRATALVAEKTGKPEKPICFSICEWGLNSPWKWGSTAGNLWRTTPDIKPYWASILAIYEVNVRRYAAAGIGNWNDPDMLEVGNGELTDTENRSHFSLWCMMNAPLILGNDIRKYIKEDGSVDKFNETFRIISDADAIAINQDPLGVQCRRTKTNGLGDVLVKPLTNNRIAVCLFNKAGGTQTVSFNTRELADLEFVSLPKSNKYKVFDVWEKYSFVSDGNISEAVGKHSVKLYIIEAFE